VLGRTFGPKRDEVTDCGIKLHNKGVRNSCSSPDIIRLIKSRKMAGACSTCKGRRGMHVGVGKPEGRRPLRRPGRR
jgi:hypothetical protein